MKKELLAKFAKEGPHGLAYEELLILALGVECAEEISYLIRNYEWEEVKRFARGIDKSVPAGVRESTMLRLRSLTAVGAAIWADLPGT